MAERIGGIDVGLPHTNPPETGSTVKKTDISFLRRQAELCIALSRTTFDLTVASRLRTMAEEFRAKADHIEGEFEQRPPHAFGRNGLSGGEMDRF